MIGVLVFVAAAIVFRIARRAAGAWTIDDAGITYSQAFELADHHSLAPGLEGTPIEGYSNPLLFFLVALLRVLGLFDPVATHLFLERLVFAGMVTGVWSLLRSITREGVAVAGAAMFVIVELVTPATWTWYGSGLENVWVSAGLVMMVCLIVRTQRGIPLHPMWGAAAFLVAITRPESPVYVVAFYAGLLLCTRASSTSWREHAWRVARVAAVTLVLFAAFLCWRRLAYHAWLPNTYYAKLHGPHSIRDNLRGFVIPTLFPYANAALFASSVIALLLISKTERFAPALVIFVVASLALPLVAGADWMGEHRFATAFLATGHLVWTVLVAVLLDELVAKRSRDWAPSRVVALVLVLMVAGLLREQHNTYTDKMWVNDVTIGNIGRQEGALRWEQQMRLGVPFPLVQIPDAGGSLFIGGMQILDNGYLTDFQMARIGRKFEPGERDQRVLNQYQHEERRPDMVSTHQMFPIDRSYLGTRYLALPGGGVLDVARDRVELPAVDPAATLLYQDDELRVYLSPETVPVAGPHGLVRVELVVQWLTDKHDVPVHVGASIEHGDHDEISLEPYAPSPGIEMYGLLVGAPSTTGTYRVRFVFTRGDATFGRSDGFAVDVVTDGPRLQQAIASIEAAPPAIAARRLAWLREQSVPRFGMTAFRAIVDDLERSDEHRRSRVGKDLLELRDNARLAELRDLPASLRGAELVILRRWLATCGADVPCIGRVVDRARRLGYLGVLDRVPEAAAAVARGRDAVDSLPDLARYRMLVGLTLARPSDIAMQWQLLRLRRKLATAKTSFPPLP